MPISTPAAGLVNPRIEAPPGQPVALDLKSLYHIRAIGRFGWTADSSALVFETDIDGRFNLWRVPARGGWPKQLTLEDDRTMLEDVSEAGRWLVYAQDRQGNEKPNLFLLETAGGPPIPLTQTEGIGYETVQFSHRGDRIAFAAELEAPGAYGIHLLDLDGDVPETKSDGASSSAPRLLVPSGGKMWSVGAWSRDDRQLALHQTSDGLHNGVFVVDLAGRLRELLPDDGEHLTDVVAWGPDGETLLVNSNLHPGEQVAPGILSVRDGTIRWLVDSAWETQALDWSPDGRFIAWTLNEAGSERLYLRDLSTGRDRLVSPGAGVVGGAAFSPDGQALAFRFGAADRPVDLWVLQSNPRPDRITEAFVGGLSADQMVRPLLVTYPGKDGTPIAAFLYLPRGADRRRPRAGIVSIRGGPTAQSQDQFARTIQYLVSRGYVVIDPNYRGSTGFGRAFQEANRMDLGGGDLDDIVEARTFLVNTGFVAPDRVAVEGGSYGGYLTLMALTKAPRLWAAGIAIVPFANWFTEYENEDETLQAFDRMMMGDPEKNRDLWIDRSPYFFVDRITAPLLILAGANDIRCPASETREIEARIRAAGGTVDVKIYEDEGHGFIKRENAIDAFQRRVRFLETHLPVFPRT